MDQRELDSRVKALQKAISEKEPVTNIISIMQTLKNDVLPTEELLRATKAGMVVAKQRANPNKDVSRLAAEIVAKWKKTVEAEKARKVKMAAGSPGNGNGNGNSSPAPAQSSDTKSYKGDKSKRKWETDEVNTKRTNDAARDACIGLLYNGLAYMSEETPASVLVKAMEIEAAAFEAYKGTTAEYKTKLRSLFQNLKNASNRELGPKIMSGEIAPAKFVIMTHEELKSTEQKKQDEKLNVENMKKAQVPMAEKSISDALRCGRCGQKKVSYSQAQTRSADEPMTTFCECTVCGNRWKFS